MGLDMSLYSMKKVKGKTFDELIELDRKLCNDELNENEIAEIKNDLYFKGVIKKRGEHIHWYSMLNEIAYWRKANEIHKWFVDNVQNYNDDCEYYRVSQLDIENLLDTLQQVYNSLKNKPLVDQVFKDREGKPYTEKTYLDKDLGVAKELLPRQDGFFFGDTLYNEYYFGEIEETITKIQNILKDFNFDENYLVYCSSW